MKKLRNDKGFTLIEVLLSIAILLLLILPLLSNFVTASKVNLKGKRTQKVTTLAGNIMESISGYSLEDVALEFNGKKEFQFLPSNIGGSSDYIYELKSYNENGYGEYVKMGSNDIQRVDDATTEQHPSIKKLINGSYIYSPPEGRNQFIYGIEGLVDEGFTFDSVITIDSEVYTDSVKYPNTMNNYKLPNLYELTSDSVSIIDPYGSNITWSNDSVYAVPINNVDTDLQGLSQLYNIHLAYLAYLENQPIPTEAPSPTPTPITYDLEEIKSKTNKEMVVKISKLNENMISVKASIIYRCNLDLNGDDILEKLSPYTVMDGTYNADQESEIEHHVYIFYKPSQFENRASILIQNDGVKCNVYIANQDVSTTSKLAIKKEESDRDTTNFYTNLTNLQMEKDFYVHENELYSRADSKDRVYEITVAIYPAGSIQNKDLSNPYITLRSTREE